MVLGVVLCERLIFKGFCKVVFSKSLCSSRSKVYSIPHFIWPRSSYASASKSPKSCTIIARQIEGLSCVIGV